MASGIFLFTRVLGIGVRLYLGGALHGMIWRYLFPSLPINLIPTSGHYFVTVITTHLHGGRRHQGRSLDRSHPGGANVQFSDFRHFSVASQYSRRDRDREAKPGRAREFKVFQTGWNADLPFGPALKAMLEEPYTLFAAFIGSTMLTMATHGTDQDMVQRMLTAPDHRKSQLSLILSGVMDLPIAAAFLTVGILLSVFYTVVPSPDLPAADNEIFGYYIVHEMPVVFRGLIIAGVFATMMGSTSRGAERARHEFHKGFLPSLHQSATQPTEQAIRAARIATSVFCILMILVAYDSG